MFTDLQEIKTAVDKYFSSFEFLELETRWDDDFDSWRVEPYKTKAGKYSYTTNSPRVLADKLISMLVASELIIRIPSESLSKKERIKGSNLERFVYGVLNINDESLSRSGEPSLREQLGWFSAIRGGVAIRPYVYKGEDGNTHADIGVWDIYRTAYKVGSQGTIWAARRYKVDPTVAKKAFPNVEMALNATEIEITDFWDEQNNGIIVNGVWGKELTLHGLDYCPVFILPVGSMPSVLSKVEMYPNTERGASVFAANRRLYPMISQLISDWISLVRRGVKVPLIVRSKDGSYVLNEDIWQTEKAATLSVPDDVQIEEAIKPSMPTDAAGVLNFMLGESQRGGFPNTAYGELGFRLSGFAIAQLQQAMETIAIPFVKTLEKAYYLIAVETIRQFASNNFKPLNIRGRTSRGDSFGYPKAVELKPKDLEKDWIPEVRLVPVLPKDDAQRFLMAQTARQSGFMSLETILEEILQVKDPELEKDKMAREFGDNLPMVKMIKAMFGYLADGDMEAAKMVLEEMRMLAQGQAKAQGGQQPQLSPLERFTMGQPGMGMPTGETGMPTSMMPPEAAGATPPSVLREEA